jgi:hypothetical protein
MTYRPGPVSYFRTKIPADFNVPAVMWMLWYLIWAYFAMKCSQLCCRFLKAAVKVKVKVKVKFTLEQATKAHRGNRGIALSLTSALGGGGWSTPGSGRFTPPRERDPVPLYRRLCGPQGRSGRVRKISPPHRIRSPDSPARSELLYRLRHPGPRSQQVWRKCLLEVPTCALR